MQFEYDPGKSRANGEKHGIDFETAQLLWDDPYRVEFIAGFQKENRYGLIAEQSGKVWCAIYTHRKERIRLISVRRARKDEEEIYHYG